MFGLSIPLITILIPIIGSLFIIITDRRNIIGIKAVSFWTTLFSLIFSFIPIFISKRSLNGEYEKMFSNGLFKCEVILDALSLLFVPIICLICLLCILWITKRKTQKKKSYYISILLFEALSIGAFYATNIFLIYILIESTIIPLYIIMAQKKDSTNKSIFYFLIYTMTSAILILTAFIIIYLNTNTCELREIYKLGIKSKSVFWLLALGVGIKLPIWPFYSWLPIVHVKNQTVCSILLASVVLKFSTLILLRIMMPLFSNIIFSHTFLLFVIISISLIFALSQLIFQDDIKAVFAYFSIIHLNTALLILFNKSGLIYYIFSIMGHSILMPVLFFTANIIDRLYGTRSIKTLASSAIQLPAVRKIISISFFALIGLPFSWGFVSEILTIQLLAKISYLYIILPASIAFVSSIFIIFIYNSFLTYKINTSTIDIVEGFYITDIYKKLAFYIPVTIIFLVGMFPKIIFGVFK